jgi:DNA-binding beta-propeller fold protein YncE/mono/diheme cytochrome c family protein
MKKPGSLGRALIAALFALLGTTACEPEARDIEPGASPESGMLAVTEDRLFVAAPDHDQLLVLDRESRDVLHRVSVGDEPSHVLATGSGVLVTSRYSHTLDVVDPQSGEVLRTVIVGVEPTGMSVLDDNRVAIALSGEAAVAIVNHSSGTVERKIALENKDPRAVAVVDDNKLYVAHVTDGVMSEVDLDTDGVSVHFVQTTNEFGPQVHPNLIRSLTVAPDTGTVMTAHSQANADTVRAPIDPGFEDEFGGQGDCGYSGCATELPAVTPSITEVDPGSGEVLVPIAQPADGNNGMDGDGFIGGPNSSADCFDCGGFGMVFVPNPPSVLNPNEPRFFGVPLNNPTAIALFDGGRGQLVLHTGSRNVLMLRRQLKGTADDVIGVVNVGHGATSIAVGPAGREAFVFNQFDGTVTSFELPSIDEEVQTQSSLIPSNEGSQTAEFREIAQLAGETFTVVEDALDPLTSRGRKLFHDALDSRISQSHAVSCASCHPDGRSDNRTWQFVFGPRNTPQLGGGILDTAPFHWPGDVETVRNLNDMTVLAFMGGTGLDGESMDAVGSFLDSIRAAPSAVALTPESERSDGYWNGKAIFESAETQCVSCHMGTHFTDNNNWDVGTRSTTADRADFQTPVLHGLNRSGPFLHDGSARDLRELIENVVLTDRMGFGSHLTDPEVDDLVEYLSSL